MRCPTFCAASRPAAAGERVRISRMPTRPCSGVHAQSRLRASATSFTRGDLQDRSIILPLDPLSGYKTERELGPAFERQRPGIFGALLDLLVQGVRRLPQTHLVHPPRMADFATLAVACGLDGFEAAYRANHQQAVNVILEHDPLAQAVQAFVKDRWEGNAQELLDALGPPTRITTTKVISDQ